MNGRLDRAVRWGCLLLAALSLVVGVGPVKAGDGPPPYDDVFDDYEWEVGVYDTFSAAMSACQTYMSTQSYYDPSCREAGGGPGVGGAVGEGVKVQTFKGNGRHEAWWLVYNGCPGDKEPNSDGKCEDPPECEWGKVPEGAVDAGECRTKCEAHGTPDGNGNAYVEGQYIPEEEAKNGKRVCFDGCSYAPSHKVTYTNADGSKEVRSRFHSMRSSCTSGEPEIVAGDSAEDGCVTSSSGGEDFCFDDLEDYAKGPSGEEMQPDDSPDNCGTYNGEKVCMGAAKDSGACKTNGGEYTCLAKGGSSVVPETGENQIANEEGKVTLEDLPNEEAENTTDDGTTTVSHGTIGPKDSDGDGQADDGNSELENDGPPEAGSDEAKEQAEEDEPSKLCKEAPHLCKVGDTSVEDREVPKESEGLADLVGAGEYSNVLGASPTCPEPQSVSLPDIVGGGSLQIPYTAMCDLAQTIRPVVIGMSYLVALFMAVRILK